MKENSERTEAGESLGNILPAAELAGNGASALRSLKIEEFDYPLPQERIALYPLPQRDQSKLLVYRPWLPESERIAASTFGQIGRFLPKPSLLVFNDTRVVRARLVFFKEPPSPAAKEGERASGQARTAGTEPAAGTRRPAGAASPAGAATPAGARIEVFCLEPAWPADIAQAFSSTGKCRFKCLIGNNKRWKSGPLRLFFPLPGENREGCLQACKVQSAEDAFIVEFSWDPEHLSFAEVLEQAGKVPLPPYLHRQAEESDTLRYQTVFALHNGSVAAPTAGLHFTPQLLESLPGEGIDRAFVTLHVGAGTFKPVKAGEIGQHHMHKEHICINRALVEKLLQAVRAQKPVIPVGTTSMRSIESLYWIGASLAARARHPEEPERSALQDGKRQDASLAAGTRGPEQPLPRSQAEKRGTGEAGPKPADSKPAEEKIFEVGQWEPYETPAGCRIPPSKALEAVLAYLDQCGAEQLHAETALMIAPGYEFAFCQGLVTNFHQPQSTLLLLVSALIGPEWKNIYRYALQNGFRFLSYGDSCLFLKDAQTGAVGVNKDVNS